MAEPSLSRRRWTSAEVALLPDDGGWTRYELIDGELFVMHAPGDLHQIVTGRVTYQLFGWNEATGLGLVLPGPGLLFDDENNTIPDVVWVSHARYATLRQADDKMHGGPELVVEVLSPGTANARRDRDLKRGLYARRGVDEYWLLDPATRSLSVCRRLGADLPLVVTLGAADTLTSPLLPGFAVAVARFFPA